MTFLTECESCKGSFAIDGQNVKREEAYVLLEEKQAPITLTFYDCPHCGRRHLVQCDNAETLRLMEKEKRQVIGLINAKRFGNKPNKKQSEKLRRERRHLAALRLELIKEYSGKPILQTGGTIIPRAIFSRTL